MMLRKSVVFVLRKTSTANAYIKQKRNSNKSFDDLLSLFIHSLRIELLILELFPNRQSILQEFQESLGVSIGLVTNLFTFHSLFHSSELGFKHAFFHGFGCFAGKCFFFLERHFTVPSSHIFMSVYYKVCL